jgi:hypothetical protein
LIQAPNEAMPPALLACELISPATGFFLGFTRWEQRYETAEQKRESQQRGVNADDH